MKNLVIVLFVGTLFLIQGCVTNTALQTGRTVGEGKSEVLFGGSIYGKPSSYNNNNERAEKSDAPTGAQAHAALRHGLTEKFDVEVGGSLSALNFEVRTNAKYQFLGDQNSRFAGSAGLGLGLDFFGSMSIETPLYFSYHPSEDLAIYTSPRYKYFALELLPGRHALGIANGIRLGKDKAFYLEHAMMERWKTDESLGSIHHFNMGYTFKF